MTLLALSVGGITYCCRSAARQLLYHPPQARKAGNPGPCLPLSELGGTPWSHLMADGIVLRGRLLQENKPGPIMLFLHGYRSNLGEMLPAAHLSSAICGPQLLLNLRAHGNSDGTWITLGRQEVADIQQIAAYCKQHWPQHQLLLWGNSMGGALALLAAAQEPGIDGIIADCPYADLQGSIQQALQRYLGHRGLYLAPFLRSYLRHILNIKLEGLSPVNHIGAIAPRQILLLSSGSDDTVSPHAGPTLAAAAGNGTCLHKHYSHASHIALGQAGAQEQELFSCITAWLAQNSLSANPR